MIYKIWIACEAYDENNEAEHEPFDLDLDFSSTAEFTDPDEATAFATQLHLIGEGIGIQRKRPVVSYRYTVEIITDTSEHADQVISERIGYDEDYGFDYSIDFAPRQTEYARVVWVSGDLEDMTDEEAAAFFEKNQRQIQDAMVNAGWNAIETLIEYEKGGADLRQPLKIDGGVFKPYAEDLSIDHGQGVCVCGKEVGTAVKWTDVNIERTEHRIAIHQVLSGCQVPRIIHKVNVLVGTVYRAKLTYRYFVRRGDHRYEALLDNGREAKVIGQADHIWGALFEAVRAFENSATQTGVKGFEINLNPASVVNGEGLVGAAPPDFNTALERYSETISRTQSTKEMVRVRLEAERYRAAFESIITLVDAKLLRQMPD